MNQNNNFTFKTKEINYKLMRCTVGRIIYNKEDELTNKPTIQIDKQKQRKLIKEPMESKEKKEKKLKQQKQRKERCELQLKSNLLYLDMLLLILDSKAQITFEQVKKRNTKDQNKTFRFHCSSIISEGKEIYNDKLHYVIEIDKERNFPTIKVDDEIGCPVVDQSNECYYNSEQTFRIQEHIVIQIINKILKQYGITLSYSISKSASKNLSSLVFTTYYDFNEYGHFILLEKDNNTNSKYQQLTESLLEFISYFIDYETGRSEKLIISDEMKTTYGLEISDEITLMGRQTFITALWSYRNLNVSMKMIFEQPEVFIYPYFSYVLNSNEIEMNHSNQSI